MHDPETPAHASPAACLNVAAQQLGFAARALSQLAQLSEEDDLALVPHAERLECRAAELMRAAVRLARDLGVASAWGLDILFVPEQGAGAAPLPSTPPASESIELEPLELLAPVEPPLVIRPRSRPPVPFGEKPLRGAG